LSILLLVRFFFPPPFMTVEASKGEFPPIACLLGKVVTFSVFFPFPPPLCTLLPIPDALSTDLYFLSLAPGLPHLSQGGPLSLFFGKPRFCFFPAPFIVFYSSPPGAFFNPPLFSAISRSDFASSGDLEVLPSRSYSLFFFFFLPGSLPPAPPTLDSRVFCRCVVLALFVIG